MDFVHPALLAGAALAAVPIILHLVMRQKPKRFEFPALRFVRQRREANVRRLRLQHLLLLALRIAAICLLALALARPSIRATANPGRGQGPIAAVLLFDTAPRMGYRHENQTRLEVAQQIARELLADLPQESQVGIVDTRAQPAVFQIDLPSAGDRIGRLEIAPTAGPILPALEEGLRLLATSDRDHKELYIFTDMAAVAWSSEISAQLAERLAALPAMALYVVDVGSTAPENCGLGELRLSSQVLSQNSPLLVSTDVACRGAAVQRDVVLEMLDAGGKPQKRNQASFQLADRQPQRVEFSMSGLPLGTHQGQLRLVGADGLSADDVRYFTVEVTRPWRVLIVAPRPLEITGSYLAEALAPERFRKQGLSRFECEVIDVEELEDADLTQHAAVFLLDPPALPMKTWQRMADFMHGGGGLGIFLGRRAAPADAFNQEIAGTLAIRLAETADGPTYLAGPKRDHPMLAKFKPLGDEVPWQDYPVYHFWKLADLPEGVTPIVSYTTGQPAIVEQTLGHGRLVVMTTSVSDPPDTRPEPWSRLLSGLRPWPFFMMTNEMALYLVGSSDSQLNYLVGQPAALRLLPSDQVSNYLLSTPANDQIRGTVAGRKDLITVAATDLPGHYRIRSGGERGIDRGFSVNLSTDATSLQRAEPGELKRVFGKREFRLAHNIHDMQRVVSRGRLGHEFFPFLIVAVALAMGFEQVLANRFYRKEKEK